MSLGSVAGFALVLLVCAWTLSTAGGLVLACGRARLQRAGPMAERRAAEATAIAPVVIAALVVIALVAQSLLGVDHCTAHGHHAHLCVAHGAQWLERTWVVVALATAGVAILGRLAAVVNSFMRGARNIRELHAHSREAGSVRIVESDRAFCFVAGGRPAIYVSSRAWSSLPDRERSALVAHESAHIRQGDLRMRAVIEAFLVVAAPLVGGRVRTMWLQATERLCDARAAEATGEPEAVASAMVSLCRLRALRPAGGLGLPPTADELAGRVHAVLAGGPIGDRAAAILAGAVIAASLALVIAAGAAAEPLHHAFETLLG